MLSVYQHWDPLEICAVGRSYPPEFYSYIKNPKVRSVMERIAIETEEDYQKLISLLESFNVTIIRNDISDNREDHFWAGHYSPPPMTPRDHTIMIGEAFFMPGDNYGLGKFPFDYLGVFADELNLIQKKKLKPEEKEKISSSIQEKLYMFPDYERESVFNQLKQSIRSINHNPLTTFPNNKKFNTFASIEKLIKQFNNKIVYDKYINAATTTRVGKDLYFGTVIKGETKDSVIQHIESVRKDLPLDFRFHIVNSETHSDSNFNPIKPGLIVSLKKNINYQKTFPDWEVVYLEDQSWNMVEPFLKLKQKNKGKWWVPGEEYNDDFTDFVETWLKDWVLYVEETVFDVNMLVIDESNVVCNNYNKDVFNAFERHGITPHLVNFRHRYFWDGGLHCITSDLSRKGTLKDYFPERNKGDYF